jgi:hypothetical protein
MSSLLPAARLFGPTRNLILGVRFKLVGFVHALSPANKLGPICRGERRPASGATGSAAAMGISAGRCAALILPGADCLLVLGSLPATGLANGSDIGHGSGYSKEQHKASHGKKLCVAETRRSVGGPAGSA